MSLLEGYLRKSSIVSAYERLRTIHPNRYVEWGRRDGDGWIPGCAFTDPSGGRFCELLERIGARMQTSDRKVIAASFVLRFGWSAGVAIGPYLLEQCVPDVSLENISLKFSQSTLFEKVSLHEPSGVVLARRGSSEQLIDVLDERTPEWGPFGSRFVTTRLNDDLLVVLRAGLIDQAEPVVDALYVWSRFSKRALWGQIASSWWSEPLKLDS